MLKLVRVVLIEAFHCMVINDRHVTVQHIAYSMGISFGFVHGALTVFGVSGQGRFKPVCSATKTS